MSEPATDEEIEHLERTGKLPSTLRLIARIRQQQKVIATLTPPPSALVEGGEKPVGYLNERSGVFVSTAYFAGLGESSRSKYAPLFATPPSRNDTIRECMAAVLGPRYPSFCMGGLDQDEYGVILPGSPHDRGIYEAHSRLRALLTDEVTK